MSTSLLSLSAYSGALAVALGAFGAHGLKNTIADPKLLKTWETAAHYHLLHSLLAVFAHDRSPLACKIALLGNLLFAGSLYGLVLSKGEVKKLGMITPLGGLCYIGSWVTLAHNVV